MLFTSTTSISLLRLQRHLVHIHLGGNPTLSQSSFGLKTPVLGKCAVSFLFRSGNEDLDDFAEDENYTPSETNEDNEDDDTATQR